MFGFSVLVSTLYNSIIIFMRRHEYSDLTSYEYNALIFVVTSSILPAWTMQLLVRWSLRRSWLRYTIWALVGMLWGVVSVLLWMSWRSGPQTNSWATYIWDNACAPSVDPGRIPTSIFPASFLGCGVITAVSKMARSVEPKKSMRDRQPIMSRMELASAIPATGLMWANLGTFIGYRHTFLQRSGGTNEESTWTFGQVLTLATWIPVFIEFGYILTCKLTER